jgi:lipopolysaccharide/colanic/teichoic acid biosynthesis glycosyltransferase
MNGFRPRNPRAVSPPERAIALVGALALSPLILLTALAVKLDSPRAPILYAQERVGWNRRRGASGEPPQGGAPNRRAQPGYGQAFMLYKFRTMIPDAEKQTGPVWAKTDDPRVTRVGRVLRRLRLDELPQLFNVVGGQMRLIGPRPERPHFVQQLSLRIPEYQQRLRIPPGITGLAQIEREYDSNEDDVRRKVKYDLFYARNRSPMMDLKIVLRTLDVMLRRKGAH